jgi:hypothetical protein
LSDLLSNKNSLIKRSISSNTLANFSLSSDNLFAVKSLKTKGKPSSKYSSNLFNLSFKNCSNLALSPLLLILKSSKARINFFASFIDGCD